MEPNNSPRSLGVFMLRLPAPAVILWLLFLYYNSKPPTFFSFFWAGSEWKDETVNAGNIRGEWSVCVLTAKISPHMLLFILLSGAELPVCVCETLSHSHNLQSTTVNALHQTNEKVKASIEHWAELNPQVGVQLPGEVVTFVSRSPSKSLLPLVPCASTATHLYLKRGPCGRNISDHASSDHEMRACGERLGSVWEPRL